MIILIGLLVITGISLFMGLRKNKLIYLAVPFLSIFLYFLIQIIMVPAPFFETVKFIFSLS
ncbi:MULTISPECIES: hypothetical protein [Mesobacillus]|uniref:Uncharacterized protein n=1 Tax=Mesobacillus selenatarsenatis TaxID=388741 RepID=A0A846TCT9_9BACI|nr:MULTISPECIES: hypothetical protein [Mesobacillus]MCM3574472.1 hypothetical protein [Mesobacillus subterraneus]NKE04629.1 hypothetical protein [Mesobacillus selenatarsenatis]UYZ21852.1 hypothetical protein FOF60_23155 [Mesobacillus jeotgali]